MPLQTRHRKRTRSSNRSGVSLYLYVLLYALATLVLYQWQVLSFVTGAIDLGSVQGLVILGTLQAVQFFLIVGLMLVLGFVSIWLMKITGAVLFIANALAQYFMSTYGTVIDPSMIGNILNTNQGEAGGLIHPMMFVTTILWGVLPALAALLVPVRRRRRLPVLAVLIAVVAGFVGTVYGANSTWLWFDDNGNRIGPRTLPWSYLGNGARYAAEYQRRNRVPTSLPDGTLTPPADNLRDVVVLVIGEAARGDHLAALGYDRETTPFTDPLGVVAYPGGRSCVTYSVGALACILSFKGNEAEVSDPFEPLPSYLSRTGVDTIVRVNNAGLPPLPGVTIQTAGDVNPPCEEDCPERWFDDQLLTGLSEQIAASTAQTVFVMLHFAGSHGPEYFRRYPPEYQVFTPICRTTLVADCTREELVNAYDNSIRFTDYALSQLIGQLQALPDTRATMLYVADHGQALGENGIYLHGLPNSMAPESQRRIPLMLWFDDEVAQARGLDRAAMSRPIENPQDMIFHTVLGALRVQSPIYRAEYDLFQLSQEGRQP
tara:strand:- start:2837 stop:4471 length:1635 start_codon:yes stop_codon:yes gene_type:complete